QIFGGGAGAAEGSRLLSGYRGKTSFPGSNPGLSAIRTGFSGRSSAGPRIGRGPALIQDTKALPSRIVSGALLLLLELDAGGLRCVVVLGDGLVVLARLMKRHGVLRHDFRVGGTGVVALAQGFVELGLQRRALTGQCGTSCRSDQGEDGQGDLHLFLLFGLSSRTGRRDHGCVWSPC